ncbi:tRNA (adenine(58)-N(1))-methyltransferase catalytic subunit TRM61 [Hypsizygus marmoreus]|uniref:tRNA (adenine(58)-N(1))-methyltransferase catalytic subunit TRM61 n=1 Tax=Hypsizygus marmoreus TaxID=39966 RepID=A0A369IYL8_HYPMA|nr:tRNA (adenine(58)-N(1))-methyltransferase catalytic subunit TRM61 [Hypsizygus marmoreus]
MWSTAREIAPGDVVIIWLTRDVIQPLLITPGKDFNSKFGHYRHADLVGIPYGSKVGSRKGKGFIHVLRPTPELWTMALPHRTQILYLADIAFITSHLNIKRGSRVIEAGTGSGSFSHSVARTIGTAGHLWSYEFHEVRASKAREEFARHGMDDIVTLTHRNVCKDGFTITDTVDSVFLDLPAPWEAVEHAKQALRKDRTTRICCFSPCMEQVLRTVNALNDAGFTDITMYETLLRPLDVAQVPMLQPISEISEKLKQAERKREDKRLKQIAANRRNASKRKREEDGPGADTPVETEDEASSKRIKTDDEDSTGLDPESTKAMDLDVDALPASTSASASAFSAPEPTLSPAQSISPAKISVSKPFTPPAEPEVLTEVVTPEPQAPVDGVVGV